VAAGLPESASPTGRKTTPTGGARLSAAERRGRLIWAERGKWAGGRKKREREVGWAGLGRERFPGPWEEKEKKRRGIGPG